MSDVSNLSVLDTCIMRYWHWGCVYLVGRGAEKEAIIFFSFLFFSSNNTYCVHPRTKEQWKYSIQPEAN